MNEVCAALRTILEEVLIVVGEFLLAMGWSRLAVRNGCMVDGGGRSSSRHFTDEFSWLSLAAPCLLMQSIWALLDRTCVVDGTFRPFLA